MKRLIAIGLSLFLSSSLEAAAPTVAKTSPNTCFITANTTMNCAFGSNVVAGNMIIACIGTSPTATTINTPTMTGETFTKITGASIVGTASQIACYATNSAVGGQTTLTATISASHDIHVHMVEITGQAASPQDQTGTANSATASVATSGSAAAHDLVIAFFFDDSLNHTMTAGGSYAQTQQTNNTTGGDVQFSEQIADSVAGVQTATATGNGTDVLAQSIIAIAGTASTAVICPGPLCGILQ